MANKHHSDPMFRSAIRISKLVIASLAQLTGRSSLRDIVEIYRHRSTVCTILAVPTCLDQICRELSRTSPKVCTRLCLAICSNDVRNRFRAMVSNSRTSCVPWMPLLKIYVYLCFRGPRSKKMNNQASCWNESQGEFNRTCHHH